MSLGRSAGTVAWPATVALNRARRRSSRRWAGRGAARLPERSKQGEGQDRQENEQEGGRAEHARPGRRRVGAVRAVHLSGRDGAGERRRAGESWGACSASRAAVAAPQPGAGRLPEQLGSRHVTVTPAPGPGGEHAEDANGGEDGNERDLTEADQVCDGRGLRESERGREQPRPPER